RLPGSDELYDSLRLRRWRIRELDRGGFVGVQEHLQRPCACLSGIRKNQDQFFRIWTFGIGVYRLGRAGVVNDLETQPWSATPARINQVGTYHRDFHLVLVSFGRLQLGRRLDGE